MNTSQKIYHLFIALFICYTSTHIYAENPHTIIHTHQQYHDNNARSSYLHHDHNASRQGSQKLSSYHQRFNNYTKQDFHHYFVAQQYTDQQILNQRCLYMFDEFVKFAQTHSSYKYTIQQLHAELKNLNILQKAYHIAKGTYCPGLQKRIHYLYHQLDTLKTEIPKNKEPVIQFKDVSFERFQTQLPEYKELQPVYQIHTPSLSHAIDKRLTAYQYMASGNYGHQYTNQSYTLNNNVKTLLTKHNLDTTRFTECFGNHVDHAIHQESLDLLERIDHISPNSLLYDHQEALIDFTVAMVDYNHEGMTHKATQIADFCWTLLDYGQAAVEGAALGVYSAATDIIHNPIEAGINIVAGKQVLMYQLSKVLYNVADIGITAISNYGDAKDKWDKYTQPLNNIIDAINKKEITLRDVIKSGTAFVVGYKTQSKLLGGLGKFCNTVKQKATRFAQNNISSFTIQQYLATPEGYLLRSIPKTSCDASCPNQYDHLKQWLQIKEFTSIIDTTQHGIERLIERGFTPKDILDLLHSPSFTKLQNNGAIVYIKQIQNNFNIMAFNQKTKKIVTAIKNIDQKALNDLGKNYGWQ